MSLPPERTPSGQLVEVLRRVSGPGWAICADGEPSCGVWRSDEVGIAKVDSEVARSACRVDEDFECRSSSSVVGRIGGDEVTSSAADGPVGRNGDGGADMMVASQVYAKVLLEQYLRGSDYLK